MDGAAGGAGRAHEVAGVAGRLVQEAGAREGVVDFRLGPSRRPVLQERGREQRVQLRAGIEEGIGLGRGVVGREVHVAQGVGNLLVHFGPRVEVQQRCDDLGVDLIAVIVARQSRADSRAHLAAGLVVGQLPAHVIGHLRLVPVGSQLPGDQGQHLGFIPKLGQVQGVDGCRDGGPRLQLRVGLAAGVGVRLYEDGVVQVLEGGRQSPGHRKVSQHVGAPEQIERRPAVPVLPVGQGHRHQCCRDGSLDLGNGPVRREVDGAHRRSDGAVRLRRRVVGRKGRGDGCISLDDCPVGHQGVRDGLGHFRGGAVVPELVICVGVGLCQEGHEVRRDLRPREVIGESSRYRIVGLLGRVVSAELGEHPGLASLGEQQGIGLRPGVGITGQGQGPVVIGQGDAEGSHGMEVADLVGSDQQIPSDLALPGRSIDQIGGTAKGGDLRQDPVYGGLQRDLQRRQLRPVAKGPPFWRAKMSASCPSSRASCRACPA